MRVKVGGEGISEGGAESGDRDEGIGVVGGCGVKGEEDQDLKFEADIHIRDWSGNMAHNSPDIRITFKLSCFPNPNLELLARFSISCARQSAMLSASSLEVNSFSCIHPQNGPASYSLRCQGADAFMHG